MNKEKKLVAGWVKLVNRLLKTVGAIIFLFVVLLIWVDQSRTFYCLSEDKCVTLWKRSVNECYVIPGKYYSVLTPSNNYIRTSTRQDLTLYFSSKLPKRIIVRNAGNSRTQKRDYELINNTQEDWQFLDYAKYHDDILYKPHAAYYFMDVKETTELIDIIIGENYALDKRGKKFK